ncbi:hypothetical protein [Botrimarina hoheduenensis]|uniref:DUF1795 domain-containing protein n=1 Tax=Botrimarina hoheduenensis TaxID=2528000 RepID=A0A5C5VVQ8_9BACT|nr:hypothetical protein [Botrimarina hoheduenensis]TWT41602.1 hypothetical protein Pla111_29790 [Botrimarina hoheduenensis]
MYSVYDRHGLQIAYPANWHLEEESDQDAQLQLTISSPATAFWTLALYPGLHDPTPLAEQALAALRVEYPDLESEPADEAIEGTPLVGRDINFICLDLTNTARVRVGHWGASTLVLFMQAEDREFEAAGPIFRAITQSLLVGPPRTVEGSPAED